MEQLTFLVNWGQNKETAWSGTNYSLYKALSKHYDVHDIYLVNVLFSALTPAHKNITFAASNKKKKSYAERESQLSGSLRSVSAVQ